MKVIKPIETYYKGYRFRSRLEARWAVFFDSLGIEYEYEPEGFDLGDGTYYLPDFKIKCYGDRGRFEKDNPWDLWVEVKGVMTREDAKKIRRFATEEIDDPRWGKMYAVVNPILIVSKIPLLYELIWSSDDEGMDGTDVLPWNYALIDGDTYRALPAVKDGCFYLDAPDYMTMEETIIEHAFINARQARFEYGEYGTPA